MDLQDILKPVKQIYSNWNTLRVEREDGLCLAVASVEPILLEHNLKCETISNVT